MSDFAFYPELFDLRAAAIEALSACNIEWFSDYTAVDLDHESYGLEVGGIKSEATAKQVYSILRFLFPSWRHGGICWEDWERDPGFWVRCHLKKVVVHDF